MWVLVVLFVILAAGVVVYALVRTATQVMVFRWRFPELAKLPGPKPSLIGGNLSEDIADRVMNKICEWRETYGNTYLLWYGGQPTIILANPEIVKQLLSRDVDVNCFAKGYENEFSPWLGSSILLARGDRWRTKRQRLIPAFHYENVEALFHTMLDTSWRLVQEWRKLIRAYSRNEVVRDIHEDMKRMSLDIIGRCAFGYEFRALDELKLYTVPYVPPSETDSPAALFTVVLEEIEARSYELPPLPNWFYQRFTKHGRRFASAVGRLRALVDGIIAKARTERQAEATSSVSRHDLMTLLLNAVDADGAVDNDATPSEGALTDTELRDDIMTFVFAGHETTSTALAWTLFELAKHPEIQRKVQEEVDAVMETSIDEPPALTPADLKQLPLMANCIAEAMRLHPPQPAFVRRAIGDVTLGTLTIPKNTDVSIVPYLLHRDPSQWERPLEFLPERFDRSEVRHSVRHPFSYIPFSNGLRKCIGASFAQMEAKIALALLLRHFEFRFPYAAAADQVKEVPAVTLRPVGLHLSVCPREVPALREQG